MGRVKHPVILFFYSIIFLVFASGISVAGGDFYKPYVWSGFYVGGHVGYGSLDADTSAYQPPANASGVCGTVNGPAGVLRSAVEALSGEAMNDIHTGNNTCSGTGNFVDSVQGGMLAGAHLGYNIQRGRFVFGIEGDYTKTRAELETLATYTLDNSDHDYAIASAYTNVELDALASVRGRLGWTADRTHLYLTAGLAWADLNVTGNRSLLQEPDTNHALTDLRTSGFSGSEIVTGYVIGAGAEHMIADGFSLRAEVLHYEFDDKGYDFHSTVARGGFSIHLN